MHLVELLLVLDGHVVELLLLLVQLQLQFAILLFFLAQVSGAASLLLVQLHVFSVHNLSQLIHRLRGHDEVSRFEQRAKDYFPFRHVISNKSGCKPSELLCCQLPTHRNLTKMDPHN